MTSVSHSAHSPVHELLRRRADKQQRYTGTAVEESMIDSRPRHEDAALSLRTVPYWQHFSCRLNVQRQYEVLVFENYNTILRRNCRTTIVTAATSQVFSRRCMLYSVRVVSEPNPYTGGFLPIIFFDMDVGVFTSSAFVDVEHSPDCPFCRHAPGIVTAVQYKRLLTPTSRVLVCVYQQCSGALGSTEVCTPCVRDRGRQ